MNNIIQQSLGVLGILISTATSLHAAEYTWDKGSGTLEWNDPINWSGDTKPGAADTATFATAGLTAGDTVMLGADQTIGTLRINGAPAMTVSGSGIHSLTLGNGIIQGGEGSGTPTHTVDAPILLGANGSFQAYGSYGAALVVKGPISDSGNGYGLGFVPSQNHLFTLQGDNTYTGDTVFGGRGLTISGANGAIRSSALVLNLRAAQVATVTLDNIASANADRLGDTKPVRVERSGGALRLTGNASTPILEKTGPYQLDSGLGQLEVSFVSGGNSLELNFAGYSRSPGTALQVLLDTTADRYGWNTNPKVTFDGLADGFLPYAVAAFYDPTHIYAEGGQLKRFTSYSTLPTSGGDVGTLYQVTASAGLTLTGNVDAKTLMIRNDSANVTVDIAGYDLRLADGSLGFRGGGSPSKSHTIQSSGGKLVFGTPEVVVFGAGGSASTFTISAPIASEASGPYHLIVPLAQAINRIALTGADEIGQYANLAMANNIGIALELGGPSNRAFTGNITGLMDLRKSGTGTLRLAGTDMRGGGNTFVTGGRLQIGAANALRWDSWGDGAIVVTNAALEVESGVVWNGRFTIQANTTLTGDGKINTAKTVASTVRVSPGKAVGKLTTAAMTFGAGSHLDWELGNGVATAGTDYDLLRIEGNLVLPTGTVTVNIGDAGARAMNIKGQSFTVMEWTGTDPANTPAWNIVNLSPETINATGALLSIDLANNKIVLTGLKNALPSPTTILIR